MYFEFNWYDSVFHTYDNISIASIRGLPKKKQKDREPIEAKPILFNKTIKQSPFRFATRNNIGKICRG